MFGKLVRVLHIRNKFSKFELFTKLDKKTNYDFRSSCIANY
ncbi:hypothetical protein SPHINGO8BC_60683 [Sphingobacterium multivorum]|uniref:Uncharacterized protein n=1 Tax=Sphingobacterium multivorum TaxID=28454 RepID=A0A654DIL4_SPHMU|nr:hypothetical protein SPHINGO8BC_60683 [Sphingobacterium multivorum]